MKNKLITFYLSSIVMFALSGIFLLDESKTNNVNKIQYLDFTNKPVYIYPKGENKNKINRVNFNH